MNYKKFLLILGIVVLFLVVVWRSLFFIKFQAPAPIEYGVTFSQKAATELGLDWKETYLAVLKDLKVKKIRMVAHWDLIEKYQGNYDFSDLEWQMDTAAKYNVEIILAVGRRTPRWPECHDPSWLALLFKEDQKQAQFSYVEQVVQRYKLHPALKIWQVENEYFLELFGECSGPDKQLLKEEIALVSQIDPDHPIMVTDSGEFGTWLRVKKLSEYLGSSIYRVVYNPWTGYVDYSWFIPASFYRLKAAIIGKPADKIIISEFQAEPWAPGEIASVPLEEQEKSMTPERFRQNIEFSKKVGFSQIYFWGVEWWYQMLTRGQPEYWETAEGLF